MKCNLLNHMKLKKGCMEETGRQEAKKETSSMPMSRVQKKLFVPDHAWAMSIFPPDVPRVELTREDARRYQAGETLPADGKGWALACCDGIPLGWGKISDGQMKNHYPKGLRRPLR